MKGLMKLAVALSVLASTGAAATGIIRPLAGGVVDSTVTAVSESGDTFVAAREVQVALDFPNGKSAQGKLFVVFEPSNRYFYHLISLDAAYATGSAREMFTIQKIGVSPARLVVISCGGDEIVVRVSTEKALTLDDAWAKSLRWAAGHLADVEVGSSGYSTTRCDLVGIFRLMAPNMLTVGDAGGLRVKFLGIGRHHDYWEVKIESRYKAKVLLEDRDLFVKAVVPFDDNDDGKKSGKE